MVSPRPVQNSMNSCSHSNSVLCTISNQIIADALPKSKESQAGDVFNSISKVGNSVGLGIAAVISSSVSAGAPVRDESAVMKGYQTMYYVCITPFSIVAILSGIGLRRTGRVGMKRE